MGVPLGFELWPLDPQSPRLLTSAAPVFFLELSVMMSPFDTIDNGCAATVHVPYHVTYIFYYYTCTYINYIYTA